MSRGLRMCATFCNTERMTTHAVQEFAEWDLADRMSKALRVSGVKVGDMADYLGMSRASVSNWINGRITPDTRTLRLFALRTGAPYEWLRTGAEPDDNGPEGGNVRPIDYKAGVRGDVVDLFPNAARMALMAG